MAENNAFHIQEVGDEIIVSKIENTSNEKRGVIANVTSVSNSSAHTFSLQQECFSKFEEFFKGFESSVYSMNTTQKNMDSVYRISEELISNIQILYKEYTGDSSERFRTVASYVIDKLRSRNSDTKRLKAARNRNNFVEPVETAIGLKWKTIIHADKEVVEHKLVQTTFNYVSIIETLESIFSDENFRKMYIDYNENLKHQCVDNVYKDFCCGQAYKKLSIFESKLTVQLQLAIDDFEICQPLKSKVGENKLCGIYMQIRNIPESYRSKLSNVFLVALVKVEDIKDTDKSFDIVSEIILSDLKLLETNGITVYPNINIKAVLIAICCDNLGANTIFGFPECFVSHYYCRFCETTKQQCQKQVIENTSNMRTVETYASYVDIAAKNEGRLDLSKGIKKPCVFNKLNNFHIFNNPSVDFLHDFLEGVVPFFLSSLFDFIIKKKVLTANDLFIKVRDYNYGYLNKKYKPSKLKLKKHNLGQSARQIYCLITRLPFIFINYRNELGIYWHAMQKLLQIMQVICSICIFDDNIKQLKTDITEYLSFIKDTVKSNLTPKHHFMCHYPEIIKKMGPVIYLWTMRYESKHKNFTDMSRMTSNYINIPKSFSVKHQIQLSVKNDNFTDTVRASKTVYDITKTKDYNHFSLNLLSLNDNDQLVGLKFVFINSNEYRKGLMIFDQKKVYEIMHVLLKVNVYLLVCQPYITLNFNSDFNSIEIKKEEDILNYQIIDINKLNDKKTYDKVIACGKQFIYADTLDVHNGFNI